jgi:hypothetical protein
VEEMVKKHEWVAEFPAIIVVSDQRGMILEMNRHAIKHFAEQGGENLIGASLFDCHSEASGNRIRALMEQRITDVHTFRSQGVRHLTIKGPWYRSEDGQLGGLVEIVLPLSGESLPDELESRADS